MRRRIWPFAAIILSSSDAIIPRGGSSSSATAKISFPAFLELDPTALPEFMAKAKDRHAHAVKAASEAYWTTASPASQDDAAEIESVGVETHRVKPPSTWSLPDFADELDNMIKVTAGASGKEPVSTPLFTPEECQECIEAAESHFQGESWTTLPSGQYDVAGFWIKSVPAVHEWFNRMLQHRLFPLLQREFPHFCSSVSQLCVDSAYVFKYTPETGRRTEVHTDSGCLSFTIALGGDYGGGGTWIEGAGTVAMQPGHVTIRPGGVRHCGQAVTSGTRYIIGGFCMHKDKVECVRMLIGLGAELASKGQYEKAKEALEAAIMINPQFDGAYSHLAETYTKLNRPDKAQEVLEHCLHKVNPRNGEVAYTLAILHYNQNEWDKANDCLDVCLQADENDVDSMLVRAQICSKQGNTKEETEWYHRIVTVPGAKASVAASAYSNLGAQQGQGSDEEISMYRKALELVPDNFEVLYSLGSAHAARKEWKQAIDAFALAVRRADDAMLQSQALKNLYFASLEQVKEGTPQGFATREEMIAAIESSMGRENYKLLAASRQ